MRTRTFSATLFLLAALVALSARTAAAQWMPDGTGYATNDNDQLTPAICPDGKGGTILVWADSRSGPYNFDIYAQRVNAVGIPYWPANGVPVCTVAGDQSLPEVVPDGTGGAIIAWEDIRDGDTDVYAQRIDSLGVTKWAAGGVSLCNQEDTQTNLQLVTDGLGGGIVFWKDFRGTHADIYAQRVNAGGVVRWVEDGRVICGADEDQGDLQAINNGPNNTIATWIDERNFDFDVYAQRVDSLGAGAWVANGVPVCVAPGTQSNPVLTTDNAGGAVIAWEDFRDDILSFDIYAQRVLSNGTRMWTLDGVSMVAEDSDQINPVVVSDGASGAIVVWQDNRATLPDIYAARVIANGTVQWGVDGAPVDTVIGSQLRPRAVSDGAGGVIIAWEDFRTSVFNSDLYAQRLNASGNLQWSPSGVMLTGAASDQVQPSMTTDGSSGAVLTWEDGRNGMSSNVYAVRVSAGGITAPTTGVISRPRASGFQLVAIHPNPCRTATSIRFTLPSPQAVTADVFDLNGRHVRALANRVTMPAGPGSIVWDARDASGQAVSGGLYWLRVTTPNGTASGKVTVLH